MTKFQEQFLKWLSTLISQSIHQYRSCIAKWIETCHFVSDTARLSLDFLSENQMFVNLGTSCTHQQKLFTPKMVVTKIRICEENQNVRLLLRDPHMAPHQVGFETVCTNLCYCAASCFVYAAAVRKARIYDNAFLLLLIKVKSFPRFNSMYFTPPKYILVRSFLV